MVVTNNYSRKISDYHVLFFQVQVNVNGIPASCRSRNCDFTFPEATAPRIMSVYPIKGGQDGSAITISGNEFPDDGRVITITIGGEACTIKSINTTQITCIPSQNIAGVYPVMVLIEGFGFALGYDEDVFFTYTPQVDEILPDIGSLFGGNVVTFNGIGFPKFNASTMEKYSKNEFEYFFHPNAYVLFDELPCFIMHSNFTSLSCIPQPHIEGEVNVTFAINDVLLEITDGYEYSSSSSSTIVSISPDSGSVLGNNQVTIEGTNFNNDVHVRIGDETCSIVSVTGTQIVCNASIHRPGTFDVSVASLKNGFSFLSSLLTSDFQSFQLPLDLFLDMKSTPNNITMPEMRFPSYTYELLVTSVSPCEGSIAGGTDITITGRGFGGNTVVTATQSGRECKLTYVDYEMIKCQMPSTTETHLIKNSGVHIRKYLFNYEYFYFF